MSQPIPLSKAKEVVKTLKSFGLYLTTIRDFKKGVAFHAVISGRHEYIEGVDSTTVKQFYSRLLEKRYKNKRGQNGKTATGNRP